MPPPLSLAQTLPPELLTQIFGWLVEGSQKRHAMDRAMGGLVKFPISPCSHDVRTVVLVCRKWRSPAQRALFRFIDFYLCDTKNLAAAVTTKPELASQVHAVCIGLDQREQSSESLGGVTTWRHDPETVCEMLETCRKIKHVIVRGFERHVLARLVSILQTLPLESLVMESVAAGHILPWIRAQRPRLDFIAPSDIYSLARKPSMRALYVHMLVAQSNEGFPPRSIEPTSLVTSLALSTANSALVLRLLFEVSETTPRSQGSQLLTYLAFSLYHPQPETGFAMLINALRNKAAPLQIRHIVLYSAHHKLSSKAQALVQNLVGLLEDRGICVEQSNSISAYMNLPDLVRRYLWFE
ncbi:hypothetical protein JCM10296v2_003065 [Rhodotorula toruloides]